MARMAHIYVKRVDGILPRSYRRAVTGRTERTWGAMIDTAMIEISTRPLDRPIEKLIYGHFLEQAFYGNIEGGIFDEGSALSITEPGPLRGCRADVLEACRALGVPVLRWPGGNFTSAYWWRDGVGPRDARPRRLELAWGSEESNRFGTPEFLAWAEAVGAEAYLAHSCRSVDDAVRWVEYTNYGGDTELTRLRAADGLPEPRRVRFWGLGNEVYGRWQMGHRSPHRYVEDAVEHARFMRQVDPELSFVAVGHESDSWLEPVVAGLGHVVDHVSLHLYGASRHLVDPSPAEFAAVVGQPLFFEQAVVEFSQRLHDLAVRHGIDRPLQIALDEWNLRHVEPRGWPEPRPGDDGGIAPRELPGVTTDDHDAGGPGGDDHPVRVNRHSPRTLADALFYAGVFHALHRAAQLPVPVGMANTVNLINANALINVRPHGLVRTATYHVWDLYQNHFGRRPTASRTRCGATWADTRLSDAHRRPGGGYWTLPRAVPDLDVSSALTDDSRLTVAVINRSADQEITARLAFDGRTTSVPDVAEVRTLGAGEGELFAANTFDHPDRVALSGPVRTPLPDGAVRLPAHSITLLDFRVEG